MTKISEKKYKEVILCLAEKLGGEIKGKKKLAKLLYFVDFRYIFFYPMFCYYYTTKII